MGTIDSNELLTQFKAHLLESSLAPATVVNYMADLRAFVRYLAEAGGAGTAGGADLSLFRLDADDIQAYCAFLQGTRSHAPATINRRLQALRKFYAFAVAQGWTLTNPAEKAPLLNETVSQRSRLLTEESVARLLAAVRQGRRRWADRDWAIIQAFLGAGLKLSELTALRLTDVRVDGDAACLVVRRSASLKATGDQPERTVPLTAEVRRALLDYLPTRKASRGVDHFFVNRDGKPLSTRSVQRLLRHYARAAHLNDLTTQALRYVFAKAAYEDSRDPETVAQLLGHRHLATTIRYLRPGTSRECPASLKATDKDEARDTLAA